MNTGKHECKGKCKCDETLRIAKIKYFLLGLFSGATIIGLYAYLPH
ncbi:MAG: hypothetical protein WA091_03085 [Minisyncoccales bacterium]